MATPTWAGMGAAKAATPHYQHSPALPFTIRSSENDNRLSAEVSGVLKYPFEEIANTLTDPASWCEFTSLNLNIKSCTFHLNAEKKALTLYAGSKNYQPPESAYLLNYNFRIVDLGKEYMKVLLEAEQGPFGTRNYRIAVESRPSKNGTHIRIHSAFDTSLASRTGTKLYLATLGRDKVGFTTKNLSSHDKPVFIKGVRGVIERNVMRYYLALKAFFNTNHLTPDKRFESRIKTWFDLTETYATQLHELERDEYLEAKRREWKNQKQLQRLLH